MFVAALKKKPPARAHVLGAVPASAACSGYIVGTVLLVASSID
jgi:hypothetical protein